ncbi:chain-length determining protein [Arthrobacter sp. R3-55]|uniref:chain-length determining protein n=1 Tax=Paenarthrobacter sp. CM16 TaxID=2738447 RepID=UPI0020A69C98|nr:chain-length determining protein [Paenarthrobacter sp. CM16]
MDPVAVLKTLWRYKVFVLPVLLLTAVAAVYMFSYAPRTYEARTTFAIVTPQVPTSEQIEKDPALGLLNSDNPYLRSADTSLVAQVAVTRLNDVATGDLLAAQGLSTDYKVERPSDAFLIDISGISDDKAQAINTAKALGERLEQDLRTIQTVNGASDRYLFTALAVASPGKATEQFSSRLRSVIVVVVAGLVLTLGSVSLARAVEASRNRGRKPKDDSSKRRDRGSTETTTSSMVLPGKDAINDNNALPPSEILVGLHPQLQPRENRRSTAPVQPTNSR